MIGRQARCGAQDPDGAAGRCDAQALRNAGQDKRLTRTILRGGAAGPDDLKRISETECQAQRGPGSNGLRTTEPGLARSRTLGKERRWPMRQAQQCTCRDRKALPGHVSSTVRGAADGPHRGGKPLSGLRKEAFDDQTQAQWGPAVMSAPVLHSQGAYRGTWAVGRELI